MTLIFNEEFAINPQSAESGGGGGGQIVNTIDWSKLGFNLSDYSTDINDRQIINGGVWLRGWPLIPRGSADETGATKFVNFSQPFEIHAKFSAPTVDTNRASCIFGNNRTNHYCESPECAYTMQEENNTFWFGLSTDGSNWTYTQRFSTSEVPKSTTGEVYETTSKYTGSEWVVSVTFKGETVTKSLTITGTPYYNNTSSTSSSYFCFGMNGNGSSNALGGGYIYLDNTYIKQNDVLVWGCETK